MSSNEHQSALKMGPAKRALCFFLLSLLASLITGQHNPNCKDGRQVSVHLFNWKWTDIAAECERFLGPHGFCAVQVSPPHEHLVSTDPWRPWWERYQPVSYKLDSRSGGEQQFIDMVQRCNSAGVRIYVDVIINHMAAVGSTGSGGSGYDVGSLQYPAVPYGPNDFNTREKCGTGSGNIENYNDAAQVRNCRLLGMPDLDLGNDYVRGKVADYLNRLIDIGVAGFRFDAAKHMWPGDMSGVAGRLHQLNTKYFPAGAKAFLYSEVIDLGGEPIKGTEYTDLGVVTEFNYGARLGEGVRGQNQLKWFSNFGEAWGMLPTTNALVFVDNHDNQRGHGAGGASILTFYDPRMYKIGNAFMLAYPYGIPRVMSSYRWDRNWVNGRDSNDWMGPPSFGDGTIKDVTINSDGSCGNGWVCEHRWRQIKNMVGFRNAVSGTEMNDWWDNGNQQVAFSRGDKGFIAINNDGSTMSATIQTGLPPGQYCDVISGDFGEDGCSGKIVTVDANRRVSVSISNSDDDPVVAIHAGSKLGNNAVKPVTDRPPSGTESPTPEGWARTVILLHKQTSPGQDVFIRGGISHEVRPGCSNDVLTTQCAIPIKYFNIGQGEHYAKYNAWRVADNRLDWYGRQSDQGAYQGTPADGSPMVWTSSDPSSSGFQAANTYGDHYWMIEVDMDCSNTEDGWFEFKAYVTNGVGWENDISQVDRCSGAAGGRKPYQSANHLGRCGHVNVHSFNSGSCSIEPIDN